MARRRKRIKWGRVVTALVIVVALVFGIYKGFEVLLKALDFSNEEVKNYCASVIVDPGHGGEDHGYSHDDLLEKDINLKVAQMIYKELEANNIKVILTRDEDVSLNQESNKDIIERAEHSLLYQADLFVSIHVNDHENDKSLYGYEVHYKNEESQKYGNEILKELDTLNISRNNGLIDSSDAMILRKNKINSLIINLGYINSDDVSYLEDDKKLEEIAKAISLGIMNALNANQ